MQSLGVKKRVTQQVPSVPRGQTLPGGSKDGLQQEVCGRRPGAPHRRGAGQSGRAGGRAPALQPAGLLCAGAAAARRPSLYGRSGSRWESVAPCREPGNRPHWRGLVSG